MGFDDILNPGAPRVIGPALPRIASLFIFYAFMGPHMPDLIAFKGVSLNRFMGQMAMSTEGIYGVPLMAAHLYCFYFGILADDTPPVGLAAYAAAAIARSPPVPTGIQGFMYDIRTAILPLMFIFNSDLILHNIDSWPLGILIFVMTCMGSFAIAPIPSLHGNRAPTAPFQAHYAIFDTARFLVYTGHSAQQFFSLWRRLHPFVR